VPAQYQFIDRWYVPAPIGDVYDVIGDQLGYTAWWEKVFLAVTGDGGPPRPGRRASIVSKGFLPYKLRWDAEVVEADPPRGFRFRMEGDFMGDGDWTLEEADGGTRATLDFRPAVEKPFVKQLTPILRPLFQANHRWAMRRGQEGIVEHMRRGGGEGR
jgi:uncharacterized protein YndB with AHSA1/START domain